MRETFFTQVEWQGIGFRELGVSLDPKSPASPEFYAAFYAKLTARYDEYDSLPEDWRRRKAETADALSQLVGLEEWVLSFGSGVGFVENRLVHEHRLRNLRLWDFVQTAAYFDPSLGALYLNQPTCESGGQGPTFDVVFMVQVLYALNHEEAITTLRALRTQLQPGGRIISFDTSLSSRENGHLDIGDWVGRRVLRRVSARLLEVARMFKAGVRPTRPTGDEQGWGWMRDNDCVESIFRDAGFSVVMFSTGAGQAVTIAS